MFHEEYLDGFGWLCLIKRVHLDILAIESIVKVILHIAEELGAWVKVAYQHRIRLPFHHVY
jgi:hypothetical protein